MRYVARSFMCLFFLVVGGGLIPAIEAADLRNLPERLDQIVIQEMMRVADAGKILSNEEFGVGSSLEEIQHFWEQENDEDSTCFRSKGVGFEIKQGIVAMVYPAIHNFYPLSDCKVLDALGDPVDIQASKDGSVKLYRYRTKHNRHHLIFIFRKMDSDTYNQMDYFVLRKTEDQSEIKEAMNHAMEYGLYYLKWPCAIL